VAAPVVAAVGGHARVSAATDRCSGAVVRASGAMTAAAIVPTRRRGKHRLIMRILRVAHADVSRMPRLIRARRV
jgi:hypothetical protein